MTAAAPAGKRLVRVAPGLAFPVRVRSLSIGALLLVLLAVASVATLTLGRLGVALADLPSALTGGAQGKDAFVIKRLRGPRLVTAMAVGAAFGLSGALFQSVTRNPLGSPDVIGLGAGAGAGAAMTALLFPGVLPVPVGAVLGAALAMTVVYLATGAGFRSPGRLVVAGIGVAAIANALIEYVVYAVERDRASVLKAYVNGSLNASSWDDALTAATALLVALPVCLFLFRDLAVVEMGDETAEALGAAPARTKTLAVLLSIGLSGAAVAAAGPIAFLALCGPQIARRLTNASGPHLALSALTGAVLLPLADLAAQQLPLFDDLPVGIYTMALGGAYLAYLLVHEWRRGTL
ncbi:iron chelate uptake ABC transporter family permease subunit [Actinocorallia sp. API 0066]|uniref:FecCD family ABC transporter permease n=1 Tax=Actinocorallia sp. API 0066 TaxID=2896846 RepID=UPI001E2E52A4|nr:iron chelate uptake ABC transporter family permease subunit [Actinocorallia sp. API 0066]MCD0448472.1 iron chelate uptake ABC transporter family permease subunit [Actinocorallia sp. API 0066]